MIWSVLAGLVAAPIGVAASSPLLAWRSGIYITGCFAGIIALTFLLLQPLLARGLLPGLSGQSGKRLHHWVGAALAFSVLLHVAALWLTNAPDVMDALLFQSPTPFSPWGVVAMWAVFLSALLASQRRRLGLRLKTWRLVHTSLAVVIVITSVVHALLIEGTMGEISKTILCIVVVLVTAKILFDLRIWTLIQGPRRDGR